MPSLHLQCCKIHPNPADLNLSDVAHDRCFKYFPYTEFALYGDIGTWLLYGHLRTWNRIKYHRRACWWESCPSDAVSLPLLRIVGPMAAPFSLFGGGRTPGPHIRNRQIWDLLNATYMAGKINFTPSLFIPLTWISFAKMPPSRVLTSKPTCQVQMCKTIRNRDFGLI